MVAMNKSAENYFINGCGRCELGGTPACKINPHIEVLLSLREILLNSELKEECKWGVPCYTFHGKNVVLLSAFKNECRLNFLNAVLFKDPEKKLQFAGENSRFDKFLEFQRLDDVNNSQKQIKNFIGQGIELIKEGKKVQTEKKDDDIPSELTDFFAHDPDYKEAFNALTPGRKKGYLIHFNQAKKSETRITRIKKCRDKIFLGKGWNEY